MIATTIRAELQIAAAIGEADMQINNAPNKPVTFRVAFWPDNRPEATVKAPDGSTVKFTVAEMVLTAVARVNNAGEFAIFDYAKPDQEPDAPVIVQ